jgi:hypothetical protein
VIPQPLRLLRYHTPHIVRGAQQSLVRGPLPLGLRLVLRALENNGLELRRPLPRPISQLSLRHPAKPLAARRPKVSPATSYTFALFSIKNIHFITRPQSRHRSTHASGRRPAAALPRPGAASGWGTTHIGRPDYGPGGEPEIPSENSPHSSVLVGGVRQRRSCALGS